MTHDSSSGSVSEAPVPALPPRRRWGIPSAVVGLALLVGTQFVVGLVVVLGWRLTGHEGSPPALSVGLAGLLPAYLAVLGWQFLVSRRKGEGMRVDYALRFAWYDVFVGVAGGVAMMALVAGGTLAMSKITGMEPSSNVGTAVIDDARQGPVLYILLVVIAFVGPFVEELHFRGMWWKAFRNRLGPVLTVILTSVVFAAIHLEPVRVVGLLLGALVLGFLRWWFDRIGPSLVAHMLVNTASAAALLYTLLTR